MSVQPTVREGTVSFRGYRTWFRVLGQLEAAPVPLVCLHGGPGVPHDYLRPLEAIASTGRPVVFYDQLGVGNSDHPDDPSLWTVDLFIDELEVIRQELGLSRLHLLGQSWGGMLAMEYALRQPPGITSMVLANAPGSMPQWIEETGRLRDQLPSDVQKVLDQHEAAGTTDHPDYVEAMLVFYKRHVCKVDPWPDYVSKAFEKHLAAPQVYNTMIGPSEFHITGTLREWDILPRLGEIRLPTLVIGGRHDEATPAITEAVHRGIPQSRWVIFEQSSHMPHVEETEAYLKLVIDFLAEAEQHSERLGGAGG